MEQEPKAQSPESFRFAPPARNRANAGVWPSVSRCADRLRSSGRSRLQQSTRGSRGQRVRLRACICCRRPAASPRRRHTRRAPRRTSPPRRHTCERSATSLRAGGVSCSAGLQPCPGGYRRPEGLRYIPHASAPSAAAAADAWSPPSSYTAEPGSQSARTRAVELRIEGVERVHEIGGHAARPGHEFVIVDTSWKNIIPLKTHRQDGVTESDGRIRIGREEAGAGPREPDARAHRLRRPDAAKADVAPLGRTLRGHRGFGRPVVSAGPPVQRRLHDPEAR